MNEYKKSGLLIVAIIALLPFVTLAQDSSNREELPSDLAHAYDRSSDGPEYTNPSSNRMDVKGLLGNVTVTFSEKKSQSNLPNQEKELTTESSFRKNLGEVQFDDFDLRMPKPTPPVLNKVNALMQLEDNINLEIVRYGHHSQSNDGADNLLIVRTQAIEAFLEKQGLSLSRVSIVEAAVEGDEISGHIELHVVYKPKEK